MDRGGLLLTISKVALYARVSTHDKEQDPENQLIKLRDFVERRGWVVYGEFIDMRSGAQSTRPELDRMLKAAKAHWFDAIVIVRIDRLGRSVRNLHNLLAELQHSGVALICTDQDIDTSNPTGKLLFTVLGAVSELELDLIRDRTKDGLARAKAQGKRLGRPPNPARTDDILRMRREGLSLRQIGQRLGISHQGVKQRLRRAGLQNRVEKTK
jgi:DNA invertase Pin-like site-specific DNA recombinase